MSTTSIKNVRVFDGEKLTELKTVVIENGIISDKIEGESSIDGSGCTLLPGLIDAHIHLDSLKNLEMAAKWGVTTMLDMATYPPETVDDLRNRQGLTDIRSCYLPATAAGSLQVTKMGYPESSIVKSVEDAERFVKEQINRGADYIKILIEDPEDPMIVGEAYLRPEIITAIVKASHNQGKIVFAHASTPYSFKTGVEAGVDVLTHTPFGAVIPQPIIDMMVLKGTITVPTMIMMKGIYEFNIKAKTNRPVDFEKVKVNVELFNKAGIPIIAGTDANDDPNSPGKVAHGESLHKELELLVSAGLTPVEALRSATCIPAETFGFKDRGVIKTGYKADLILVEGDPTIDISATQKIKAVWINGIKVN